jgi:hypothetical protein
MIKKIINKVKILAKRARGLFPSALPQGMSEFEAWSEDILQTYGFPSNDSFKFALATMIMHGGPTQAYKSKHYFMLMLRAAAAKQIAGAVFVAAKEKQKAEELAKQKSAEVPASPLQVPNSVSIQNAGI